MTAQCDQIESNIVQLRREQKRRRHPQERCKKKRCDDPPSYAMNCPSRGCGILAGSGFALLEVFSLALKRTVGGLAACKMGLATCQHVSVHSVLAWEHKAAASLLAQSRVFYRCHLHQLVSVKLDFFWCTEKVGNHWVSRKRHEQEDTGK